MMTARQLGDAERQELARPEVQARFWRFVGPSRNEGECWLWGGTIARNGYGVFSIFKVQFKAHRLVYESIIGPLQAGQHLHHRCQNTACVNPQHLQPVSPAEHVMIGASFSAKNARKTHCLRGHPFSGSNLRIDKFGYRICLTCRRASGQVQNIKRKGFGKRRRPVTEWTTGERVVWTHAYNDGYGYTHDIPATVVRASLFRVVIDAETKAGGIKRATVLPASLRKVVRS